MNKVLQKLPLFDQQNKTHAKWVDFCGFKMPVQFSAIKKEYESVRNNIGVFDISHMFPISIISDKKEDIHSFLEYLTCRNVHQTINKAQYNVLTNTSGGIIDDILIYCVSSLYYIIIANASNRSIVTKHLNDHKPQNSTIQISPYQEYIFLAIQGPQSTKVITEIATKLPELDLSLVLQKKFYSFHAKEINNFLSIYSRTGYTGEDGFELLVPINIGIIIWDLLMQLNITPCGLAARDLLRMEVFYHLHGNELSPEYTPFESNLKWLINQKIKYLGIENVTYFQQNPRSKLIGFQMNSPVGVPRKGYLLYSINEEPIGNVTSGSFSFQWNLGFGLARIIPSYEQPQALISIRDKFYIIDLMKKTPHQGSLQKS